MTYIRKFLYTRVAKPVLFSFSPDQAHAMTIRLLRLAGGVPGVSGAVRAFSVRRHPELECDWRGIHMSSPVGLSAGLDKNGEAVAMMKAVGFGFTTIGSVTAIECKGNPKPWFYRLPKSKSLVVHAGLANHGVDAVLPRLQRLPKKLQAGYPKILSIARTNSEMSSSDEAGVQDFYTSFVKAQQSNAVQAIEINISCPNAFTGERFTQPELFKALVEKLETVAGEKPVFVKMPIELPAAQFNKLVAVAADSKMITGLTFGNLRKNRDGLDLKDPLTDDMKGGISGPPTKDLSTALIAKVYKKYGDRFTLIGVGGILSAEDAYEKIKAGATFVGMVTGLIMNGPQFVEEVNAGLVKLLRADGYEHISEAVGASHRI